MLYIHVYSIDSYIAHCSVRGHYSFMDNVPVIITNTLDTISSSLCGFKQLKRILYQHQIYPNELRTSHYEYSTRNELQTTNHSSAKDSTIAKI